jgi:beta-glucosidase
MVRALDDRVRLWATLNEPWVVTDGGYLHGPLAPGHRNKFEAPLAAHNLMRAHGRAVQAYRAVGRNKIGLVVNLEPKYPASASDEDRAAVRRADAYMNRQYLDPAFFGEYPKDLIDMYGEAWPRICDGDMPLIKQPLDFLGINYYKRAVTKHDDRKFIERASEVRQPQATYTETGWEVHAPGLTDTLLWVRDRYGNLPLYITENGAAFYDPPVAENGTIRDPLRVDYLRKHIGAVRDAMDQGVDVRGYFVWSLLDNFEWALGYAKRFGIIHVDYKTLKRTPKESARFYADVIRNKGLPPSS